MRFQTLAAACCALALSFGCSYSDSGLTTSVKTKLAADDTVKALNIDVDTKNRVVTLKGEVRSQAEEARPRPGSDSSDGARTGAILLSGLTGWVGDYFAVPERGGGQFACQMNAFRAVAKVTQAQ